MVHPRPPLEIAPAPAKHWARAAGPPPAGDRAARSDPIAHPTAHPWEDRYSTPTPEALLGGIAGELAAHARGARELLRAVEGLREHVRWTGIPWRWTLSYQVSPTSRRASAYLILQPDRPMVAVPIPGSILESLSRPGGPRVSRAVHEGIAAGPHVGDVRWACWALGQGCPVAEIVSLVRAERGGGGDVSGPTGAPDAPAGP